MLLRTLTGLVSPAGSRARLTTFIFHRVLDEPDDLLTGEPDRQHFGALLDWISEQYQVLDPVQACERLVASSLPERAAVITFDDGYADNYQNALPLLSERRLKACFFVATGFTAGGAMFNDRVIGAIGGTSVSSAHFPWLVGEPLSLEGPVQKRQAVGRVLGAIKARPLDERDQCVEALVTSLGADAKQALMMTEEQIRGLAKAGMTVGGHTRHHPILKAISPEDSVIEIEQGRQDLTDMLGDAPVLFAYPNGAPGRDFDTSHMQIVSKAGYQFAFSTHKGAATSMTDRFAIPRFTPWDRTRGAFSVRAVLNTFGGDPGHGIA
ncbi:MAG: polysaccharide deacetylase family protein [Burkholderiaceae bacterium]